MPTSVFHVELHIREEAYLVLSVGGGTKAKTPGVRIVSLRMLTKPKRRGSILAVEAACAESNHVRLTWVGSTTPRILIILPFFLL